MKANSYNQIFWWIPNTAERYSYTRPVIYYFLQRPTLEVETEKLEMLRKNLTKAEIASRAGAFVLPKYTISVSPLMLKAEL